MSRAFVWCETTGSDDTARARVVFCLPPTQEARVVYAQLVGEIALKYRPATTTCDGTIGCRLGNLKECATEIANVIADADIEVVSRPPSADEYELMLRGAGAKA